MVVLTMSKGLKERGGRDRFESELKLCLSNMDTPKHKLDVFDHCITVTRAHAAVVRLYSLSGMWQ